jgi:hypothetical protein
VLFVDGSRLFGRDVRLQDETLQVTVEGSAAPLQVSFEIGFVRGVVALTSGSEVTAIWDAAIRQIESGKTSTDVAWLVGGDQVSGELLSINADAVTMKTSAGSIEIAWSRIESIQCNSGLLNPSTGVRDNAAVVLADGSSLAGTLESLGESSLRFATNGATLEISLDQVRGLTIYGRNAVRLDTQTPAKIARTPFLPATESGIDPEIAFRTDRHVGGGLLNVGGRTFTHGLGVPSGIALTYVIPPEAKAFQATLGIDDSTGPAGSAAVEIQVDRRSVWTSPVLRGSSPAVDMSVDVRGGKELTLTIRFAEDGDILDRVDFGEPVFLLDR